LKLGEWEIDRFLVVSETLANPHKLFLSAEAISVQATPAELNEVVKLLG
jgi:hypothetical protein